MKITRYLAAVAALFLGSHLGHSAVSITLMEVGNDVVASGSGTINLTGLSPASGNSSTGGIQPSIGYLAVGPVGDPGAILFSGHSGPTSFGSGPYFINQSSGTGDRVNIHGTSNLRLPVGYTSNSPLSFTSIWLNRDFDYLGVDEGVYTWTWGTGENADSLTLTIGVPEPGTYAVIAGALALGLAVWRRRKN